MFHSFLYVYPRVYFYIFLSHGVTLRHLHIRDCPKWSQSHLSEPQRRLLRWKKCGGRPPADLKHCCSHHQNLHRPNLGRSLLLRTYFLLKKHPRDPEVWKFKVNIAGWQPRLQVFPLYIKQVMWKSDSSECWWIRWKTQRVWHVVSGCHLWQARFPPFRGQKIPGPLSEAVLLG